MLDDDDLGRHLRHLDAPVRGQHEKSPPVWRHVIVVGALAVDLFFDIGVEQQARRPQPQRGSRFDRHGHHPRPVPIEDLPASADHRGDRPPPTETGVLAPPPDTGATYTSSTSVSRPEYAIQRPSGENTGVLTGPRANATVLRPASAGTARSSPDQRSPPDRRPACARRVTTTWRPGCQAPRSTPRRYRCHRPPSSTAGSRRLGSRRTPHACRPASTADAGRRPARPSGVPESPCSYRWSTHLHFRGHRWPRRSACRPRTVWETGTDRRARQPASSRRNGPPRPAGSAAAARRSRRPGPACRRRRRRSSPTRWRQAPRRSHDSLHERHRSTGDRPARGIKPHSEEVRPQRVDLFRDGQSFIKRDCAARDAPREVITLDEFHHEGVHAPGLFEPVNRGDVRMVQRRERLRFALEPCQAFGVGSECVWEILIATWRPSVVSVARYTCPIPPSPMGAAISYKPRRVPGVRDKLLECKG